MDKDLEERLTKIFFPEDFYKKQQLEENDTHFVHYTSASAAMEIIKSKKFWMRETSCMNDFKEVEHGLECVLHSYNETNAGRLLKDTLNKIYPGITKDIQDLFNGWFPYFKTGTFICSVSEHDASEDEYGRLSMWRAYSESSGVALVIPRDALLGDEDYYDGLYASSVAYLNKNQFNIQFETIVKNIVAEADFVKSLGREIVTNCIFQMLRFAVLCTKHPGFAEEREWRLIYCPALQECPPIDLEIETIKGIPQPICKIPIGEGSTKA